MKLRIIAILAATLLVLISFSACANSMGAQSSVQKESSAEMSVSSVPQSSAAAEPQSAEPAEDDSNKIKNGDFAYGESAWGLYKEGGVAEFKATTQQQGLIQIKKVGPVAWGVQLTNDGISLSMGNIYKLSFEAASTVPRTASIRIQKNAAPYTGYFEQEITLTPEMQSFSFDFEMLERSDPTCRLVFNFGTQQSDGAKPNPEEHEVTVDNFELRLLEGSEELIEYEGNKNIPPIHVDQLGYRTGDVKKAILVSDSDAFEICDAETGKTVYSGKASEKKNSPAAGEDVRVADFTDFKDTGRFYIQSGGDKSYEFDISADPYQNITRAVLDMMEYQKCGVAVDAGVWSYAACHTSEAIIYGTEKTKDVSGGWHDAGDYGRYVSPAAKAVTDFLLAYELGKNPDPVILEIVRYELDWMLKMQDEETGGVYHKVSAEKFCGTIMPDEETDPLYLSPISATATGGFSASMALASRIYRASDAAYADKLLAASKKAWDWLEANPQYPAFKNPEGITTGEYPDAASKDERLWAACELYSATREARYNDYITGTVMYAGLGWADVGYYASIAYTLMPETATDAAQRERMKTSLLGASERIIEAYAKDPYMMSLEKSYPWGSNMTVANNAIMLLVGDRLQPNAAYTEAAMEHMHYLFGRNALSRSYITGFGEHTAEYPHHRPSEVAGKAVPGMVVGGPDGQLEDPFVATMLAGLPPAKCYADSEQSYSSNEVTIYWNSAAYLALSMLGI